MSDPCLNVAEASCGGAAGSDSELAAAAGLFDHSLRDLIRCAALPGQRHLQLANPEACPSGMTPVCTCNTGVKPMP